MEPRSLALDLRPHDAGVAHRTRQPDNSLDQRASAEIVMLLEQLCEFALDDDTNGVTACSSLLSRLVKPDAAETN